MAVFLDMCKADECGLKALSSKTNCQAKYGPQFYHEQNLQYIVFQMYRALFSSAIGDGFQSRIVSDMLG